MFIYLLCLAALRSDIETILKANTQESSFFLKKEKIKMRRGIQKKCCFLLKKKKISKMAICCRNRESEISEGRELR